jgi:hypothetical protein
MAFGKGEGRGGSSYCELYREKAFGKGKGRGVYSYCELYSETAIGIGREGVCTVTVSYIERWQLVRESKGVCKDTFIYIDIRHL